MIQTSAAARSNSGRLMAGLADAGALRAVFDLLRPQGQAGLATRGVDGRHHRASNGAIDGLAVALSLENLGGRPLVYEIDLIATSLGARTAAGDRQTGVTGILAPGMATPFTSAFAAVKTLAPGQQLTGAFELRLRYGRPGQVQQTLAFTAAVSFKARSATEIAAFQWTPI